MYGPPPVLVTTIALILILSTFSTPSWCTERKNRGDGGNRWGGDKAGACGCSGKWEKRRVVRDEHS